MLQKSGRGTVAAVRNFLRQKLAKDVSDQRCLEEARILVEEAVQRNPEKAEATLKNWIDRRVENGEPVAYIVEKAWFWSLEFKVSKDVLIPRPCSEVLVETAVEELKRKTKMQGRGKRMIVDFGTGPGTLLLSAMTEIPESLGIGCDLSEPALQIAKENARLNGLDHRSSFVQLDFTLPSSALPKLSAALADQDKKTIDILLSNPPYLTEEDMKSCNRSVIDHEPSLALFGGTDGLRCYRALADRVEEMREMKLLDGSSKVVIEAGAGQASDISRIFMKKKSIIECGVRKDLSGVERCVFFSLRP